MQWAWFCAIFGAFGCYHWLIRSFFMPFTCKKISKPPARPTSFSSKGRAPIYIFFMRGLMFTFVIMSCSILWISRRWATLLPVLRPGHVTFRRTTTSGLAIAARRRTRPISPRFDPLHRMWRHTSRCLVIATSSRQATRQSRVCCRHPVETHRRTGK